MIESMGQFIGVGLGVVGLSFIAGAQSKKCDDGDYSDEAVSAPKPKSSTSTSANKPSMPKQTIAGGVAGGVCVRAIARRLDGGSTGRILLEDAARDARERARGVREDGERRDLRARDRERRSRTAVAPLERLKILQQVRERRETRDDDDDDEGFSTRRDARARRGTDGARARAR